MKQVRVISVGSTILSDDGIGWHVLRELEKAELPAGVHLVDAGLALTDVLNGFEDVDEILLLDAVKGGGKPGDIYAFDFDELPRARQTGAFYRSVHQMGLESSVALARLAWQRTPRITVVGVEPACLEMGEELSPVLKARLPDITRKVLELITPLDDA